MARELRKIKVAPGSEVASLLSEVADAPLLLEKNGELFRLDRMQTEQENIWKNYDPQKVKEGLKKSAGAFQGVDRDALLRDIHEQRQQDSHGRPA